MITVLVWIGITVPYRLAFDSPAVGGWLLINIFTECVLLSDIVVQFRTAYFDAELGGLETHLLPPQSFAHTNLLSHCIP
jgi:hypothetical protein